MSGNSGVIFPHSPEGDVAFAASPLAEEHLLVPLLSQQNEYDEAAVAKARKEQNDRTDRLKAAQELVDLIEIGGVPPERIKAEFSEVVRKLTAEARKQGASKARPRQA